MEVVRENEDAVREVPWERMPRLRQSKELFSNYKEKGREQESSCLKINYKYCEGCYCDVVTRDTL